MSKNTQPAELNLNRRVVEELGTYVNEWASDVAHKESINSEWMRGYQAACLDIFKKMKQLGLIRRRVGRRWR